MQSVQTSLIIKDRSIELDIIKGIGIVFMVMGHVGYGGIFSHFIHAFHMPLFFLVSGYLYRPKPLYHRIQKRFRTLMVPYIVTAVLYIGVYLIGIRFASSNPDSFDFASIAIPFLLVDTSNMVIGASIWFLWTLFIVDISYAIIDRIKIETLKNVLIIVMSLTGYLITLVCGYTLFCLTAILIGIGLYRLGALAHTYKSSSMMVRLLNAKPLLLLVMSLAAIVLIFINGDINMRTGVYSNFALFWINAVLSTIILYNISRCISKYMIFGISRLLTYISINSIVFVCLNQLYILVLNEIISLIIPYKIIVKLLITVLTFVVLLFTVSIKAKVKSTFFFKNLSLDKEEENMKAS